MITSFGGLARNGNNGTVSVNLDLKQKLKIYFLIAECVLNFILEVGVNVHVYAYFLILTLPSKLSQKILLEAYSQKVRLMFIKIDLKLARARI